MKNQLGDKCCADSMKIWDMTGFKGEDITETGKIALSAEVDGIEFDSAEYNSPQDWLQAITERVYDCAMGKLDFNDSKSNERE